MSILSITPMEMEKINPMRKTKYGLQEMIKQNKVKALQGKTACNQIEQKKK